MVNFGRLLHIIYGDRVVLNVLELVEELLKNLYRKLKKYMVINIFILKLYMEKIIQIL